MAKIVAALNIALNGRVIILPESLTKNYIIIIRKPSVAPTLFCMEELRTS